MAKWQSGKVAKLGKVAKCRVIKFQWKTWKVGLGSKSSEGGWRGGNGRKNGGNIKGATRISKIRRRGFEKGEIKTYPRLVVWHLNEGHASLSSLLLEKLRLHAHVTEKGIGITWVNWRPTPCYPVTNLVPITQCITIYGRWNKCY